MKFVAIVFFLSLLLGGCVGTSSSTTVTAKSAPAAAKETLPPELLGKWKGKVNKKPVDEKNPGAKLGEAISDMFTDGLSLEFPDNSHFKMTFMMIPVEGKVERDGKNLTLITEKVAGLTEEEAKKLQDPNAKGPDYDEPLKAQISEDGKSILLLGTKDATETVTFVRGTEHGKPITSTTTKEESAYVGTWKADMASVDMASLTEEQKKDWPMMKGVIESSTIDLKADNTFAFSIMVEVEGKWKLEGSRIRLDAKKAMGMESDPSSNKPIWLSPNGELLMIDSEMGEGPKMGYRKK